MSQFLLVNIAKRSTLMHGNKAKLKLPSLALLRFKMTFEIFELGHIAVQIGLVLLPCTSVFFEFLEYEFFIRYMYTDFFSIFFMVACD